MSKLPVVSGQECRKALEKIGFYLDHQTGSHMIMARNNPAQTISVPNHREIKKGTLRSIIRQTNLTVDEFVDLLN